MPCQSREQEGCAEGCRPPYETKSGEREPQVEGEEDEAEGGGSQGDSRPLGGRAPLESDEVGDRMPLLKRLDPRLCFGKLKALLDSLISWKKRERLPVVRDGWPKFAQGKVDGADIIQQRPRRAVLCVLKVCGKGRIQEALFFLRRLRGITRMLLLDGRLNGLKAAKGRCRKKKTK